MKMKWLDRKKSRFFNLALIFVLMLALLIPGLFGCSEKQVSLSFFGNRCEAPDVEAIQSILDGYMAQSENVSITYESFQGSDYFSELKARMASEEPDDIFMIDYGQVRQFSKAGRLENLRDVVEALPFSESVVYQMEENGRRFYWAPVTLSAYGLYCNMDLLEEHNLQVPRKLEEWVDTCEYFMTRRITPIIANKDMSLQTLAIAKGFYPLYKNGVAEGKFQKINEGEKELSTYLSEGFTLARDFCYRGYIDTEKALETEALSDDLEEFVKGESPFMLSGAWAADEVKAMAPDFEFKVVPYPVLEEGAVVVVNPDLCLSISSEGKDPERAKEFLSYFFQKEHVQRIADNHTALSPLEGSYEPAVEEIRDVAAGFQAEAPVFGIDRSIEFPIWEITAEVSRRLLEGDEVEETMEWMDGEVRRSLN